MNSTTRSLEVSLNGETYSGTLDIREDDGLYSYSVSLGDHTCRSTIFYTAEELQWLKVMARCDLRRLAQSASAPE